MELAHISFEISFCSTCHFVDWVCQPLGIADHAEVALVPTMVCKHWVVCGLLLLRPHLQTTAAGTVGRLWQVLRVGQAQAVCCIESFPNGHVPCPFQMPESRISTLLQAPVQQLLPACLDFHRVVTHCVRLIWTPARAHSHENLRKLIPPVAGLHQHITSL